MVFDVSDLQMAETLRHLFRDEKEHDHIKGCAWDFVRALVADRCEAYHLSYILGRCPISPGGLHVLTPGVARVFDHLEHDYNLKKMIGLFLMQFEGKLLPAEAVGAYIQRSGEIAFVTYRGIVQPVSRFRFPFAA